MDSFARPNLIRERADPALVQRLLDQRRLASTGPCVQQQRQRPAAVVGDQPNVDSPSAASWVLN